MALEKATVSINLGNGIDQKTDSKVGPDNKFNAMYDWIFDKLGKIYKRFGTRKLPATVVTTFPDPLSIGSSNIPSSMFAHNDQLLIQNKGALYSYYEDQQDFYFKGHHYPIEIDSQISVASELQYSYPTSAYSSGIRMLTYLAYDPLDQNTSILKYTAIENSTGNILVDDQTVESVNSLSTALGYQQIMVFSDSAFLVWQNDTNIKIAEISLTDGTLGSISTLLSSIKTPSLGGLGVGDIDSEEYAFSFSITNKSGIGERAIFAYYTSANNLVIIAIKNDGTIDGAISSSSTATVVLRGMSTHYNAVADRFYVAVQGTTFTNRIFAYSFTSSAISLQYQSNIDPVIQVGLRRTTISFTMADDPITPAQTYVFFDGYYENTYEQGIVIQPSISKSVVDASAVVSLASPFSYGLQLASKAYKDSERSTIYVAAKNCSGLQTTLFLYDILKGKNENAPYVQGKWRYGTASATIYPVLPDMTLIDSSLYFSNEVITDKIGNPSENLPIQFPGTLFDRIGILESFINLYPSQSASYSYLSRATHSTGGYLGYYDGEQFVESNYFLQPEYIDYSKVSSAGVRISLTVTQQGTVSLPEITAVLVYGGPLQLAGPLYYWTFSTTVSLYYVYYIIDGVGTSPGIVGTPVPVNISYDDTAQAVRDKTTAAIIESGANVTIAKTLYNSFTITNVVNGVVTDASATNYTQLLPYGLGVGTYSWLPVWTWFDVNGQVVYSAPGDPIQKTVVSNDVVALVAFAPPLTNRNVSSVRVQWYRTKAAGSTFFKISDLTQDREWNINVPSVGLMDFKPDQAIDNSPELLYTTGGVLPNFQVPSLKNISTFKNRIVASGGDDSTLLYYSKTAIEGVPVEFAEEFQIKVDNDSDPISGHIQLDDKLIIFKEEKIYYVAGDGPNDTGGNNSLSVPLSIATDVGAVEHNSLVICPIGVMFKSSKGIYLIDRSLQVSYKGKEVEDFNEFTVSSAELVKNQNQIRFTLNDTPYSIVYDYVYDRWAVFSKYGAEDACVWKGQYARIGSDGRVYLEDKTIWIDVGSDVESYSPRFETHWMQIKGVQDFQRIYKLAILGDLKSPHNLHYRIYYDYDETQYDSYTFSSSNIYGSQLGDSVYQPIIHLRQQKCDSIKIVIEVEPLGGTEESLQLVDMSFIVGVKKYLQKVRARKML